MTLPSPEFLLPWLVSAVTAFTGFWMAKAKQRSEEQVIKGDRVEHLETRIDALETRLDDERRQRHIAETNAHTLRLGLATLVDYIDSLMAWIAGGRTDPEPQIPQNLERIRALIIPTGE